MLQHYDYESVFLLAEEFSRPNSGRLSRAAWENDVFDHGPDIPTISAGLAGRRFFLAIFFMFTVHCRTPCILQFSMSKNSSAVTN